MEIKERSGEVVVHTAQSKRVREACYDAGEACDSQETKRRI